MTIAISVYVRRALGPEAVGQVSWAVAAITYLTVLVTPGLLPVVQREIARSPERTQPLMALVLTMQSLLACIVFALVMMAAWFEPRGPVLSMLLAIQGVTLFFTAWYTGWVLQAHERMVAPGLAALVFNALQFPALMLMVDGPDDLVAYAALTVVFAAGPVVFNVWYLSRCGVASVLQLRPTLVGWRRLLREARPLALSQAALLVIANTGILVLGLTHGDDDVGQFASAYRLMLVANVVTAALWNAYFPAFARADGDRPQAVRLSREYLGLLAWMGLPMAALGWLFGRHVVELLYGPAFAPAGAYFEWLCLAVGISFLNYGLTSALVPWGRADLQFRLIAAAAVLNLVVVGVAVPLWGGWGAVAAIVASEAVALAFGAVLRWRAGIHWHPVLPAILPPLACSAAAVVVLVALPPSLDRLWWLQLGVGALAIGLCMVMIERRALRHAWQTFRAR